LIERKLPKRKTSIPLIKRRWYPLFTIVMDIDLKLLPLSTLTPISTLQNVLLDKPTEPSISVLFPEASHYWVPNNPFRGPLSKALEETHRTHLSEALNSI
jgi:hypothetical protein